MVMMKDGMDGEVKVTIITFIGLGIGLPSRFWIDIICLYSFSSEMGDHIHPIPPITLSLALERETTTTCEDLSLHSSQKVSSIY